MYLSRGSVLAFGLRRDCGLRRVEEVHDRLHILDTQSVEMSKECTGRQTLGENIGDIFLRSHILDLYLLLANSIVSRMELDANCLGFRVGPLVVSDGDGRLVVAVKLQRSREGKVVMDMVIFRTIFFELLVFFTFTLLTIHSAY